MYNRFGAFWGGLVRLIYNNYGVDEWLKLRSNL